MFGVLRMSSKTYLLCTRKLFPRIDISIQFDSEFGACTKITCYLCYIHVFTGILL